MPKSINTIISHPFRLNMYDNGSTSIEYAGFSNAMPCHFSLPEISLIINGERINDLFSWRLIDLSEETRGFLMIAEGAEIEISTMLGIHPIHKTPTRLISLRNKSEVPITNIDFELLFRLASDSPYAVLSSSDDIALSKSNKKTSTVDAILTTPRLLSASSGNLEHVSSLVFRKDQNAHPNVPHLPEQLKSMPIFQSWRDGVINIEASPAYRFSCSVIEPTELVGLSINHWFLKTITDSCGFSGFAYVVPRDDWKATLACMSLPTHIESDNTFFERNIGLLSPIEFYNSYSAESIEAAIQSLSKRTNTSTVYLIHPESTSNDQINEMHNSVKPRVSLSIISNNDVPRSVLVYTLRKSIYDLLSAGPLARAPEATRCVAIDGDISVEAINAALYCKGDVTPVSDLLELYAIISACGYKTVSLVGHSSEFEAQLNTILELESIDVNVERFQVEHIFPETIRDGTEWAFIEATKQTIANAALSMFVLNDDFYLQSLEEVFRFSYKLSGIQLPDVSLVYESLSNFADIAALKPDETVRSTVYASVGPPGLVVGVLEGSRWQDAVLAASFARAKKLPLYILDLDESTLQELLTDVHRLGESVVKEDAQVISLNLGIFDVQKLGKEAVRALKHLPRKAITIFSPRIELPWELLSWTKINDGLRFLFGLQYGINERQLLLGSYYDIGRMGAGTSSDTTRVVWRSIAEANEPMFTTFERVLFVWDEDVDHIIGKPLEAVLGKALSQGFIVDVLVPPNRLQVILDNHGASDNLQIRDVSTKSKLLHLLSRETYALIFMAAHGGEPETVGHMQIAGETLLDHELPQMSGYPVIVLNSCWTGRGLYDDLQSTNAGIAVRLLDRGAFQVLAPIYPVSGVSAAVVSQALLTSGLTRSAARVLRHLKNDIEIRPEVYPATAADVRWFVAYGDSTAIKFFDIDGIAEMEDVAQKISVMMPNLDELSNELSGSERLQMINLGFRQMKEALIRAKKWGESALSVIKTNETYWGSAGQALRENAEVEYENISAFVDRSLENMERVAEILRRVEPD